MEWTKIPTDLLESRNTDREIIAIVKYQLLWAALERQPSDKTALRYLTEKQLNIARDYLVSIQQQVLNDIKSVKNKRNRDKIFYMKKQALNKNSDVLTDARSDILSDTLSASTDKIRLESPPYIPPKDGVDDEEFFKQDIIPVIHPQDEVSIHGRYSFEGNVIKLRDKDFNAWKKSYPNINLVAELDKIDDWLHAHGIEKNWFFRVSNMLKRKNEEAYNG